MGQLIYLQIVHIQCGITSLIFHSGSNIHCVDIGCCGMIKCNIFVHQFSIQIVMEYFVFLIDYHLEVNELPIRQVSSVQTIRRVVLNLSGNTIRSNLKMRSRQIGVTKLLQKPQVISVFLVFHILTCKIHLKNHEHVIRIRSGKLGIFFIKSHVNHAVQILLVSIREYHTGICDIFRVIPVLGHGYPSVLVRNRRTIDKPFESVCCDAFQRNIQTTVEVFINNIINIIVVDLQGVLLRSSVHIKLYFSGQVCGEVYNHLLPTVTFRCDSRHGSDTLI